MSIDAIISSINLQTEIEADSARIASLNLATEILIPYVRVSSVNIQVEIAEFGVVGDELSDGIIGTKFKKGSDLVQEIKSIQGVELSSVLIDVSTLQTDRFREYIASVVDSGLVVVSGFFYPGDLTGQYEIFDDSVNRRLDNYTIQFPESIGGTWTFDAYVADYSTGAKVEDAVQWMAALKITGQSWLGYLESGGADDIYFVGDDRINELTDVVFWPPNDTQSYYRYAVRFTTDATFAVHVTAGNHNIRWWKDDVYMGVLTSDLPSESHIISAGDPTKIQIKVWEDDKSPIWYEYMLTRTV